MATPTTIEEAQKQVDEANLAGQKSSEITGISFEGGTIESFFPGLKFGETETTPERFSRIAPFAEEESAFRKVLEAGPEEPNEADIRKEALDRAQASIDLIKTTFNEIIRGEERAGEIRGQRQRALNISGGLAGSDFATQGAERVEADTRKIIEARQREQAAAIAQVLAAAEERGSEEFQSQSAAFLKSAEGNLTRIQEFNDRLKSEGINSLTGAASSGLSFSEFKTQQSGLLAQILEETGFSEFEAMVRYNEAIPEEESPQMINVPGGLLFVRTDPVTGKTTQEFQPYPEGVQLGEFEEIDTDRNGNPTIVTYDRDPNDTNARAIGSRVLTSVAERTEEDDGGGGGGGNFTDTQLNNGSAVALKGGIDRETFNSYSNEIKNVFINSSKSGLSNAEKSTRQAFEDGATIEEVHSTIDQSDFPDEVKQYLKGFADSVQDVSSEDAITLDEQFFRNAFTEEQLKQAAKDAGFTRGGTGIFKIGVGEEGVQDYLDSVMEGIEQRRKLGFTDEQILKEIQKQ